jgi:hypothetical protein
MLEEQDSGCAHAGVASKGPRPITKQDAIYEKDNLPRETR